MIANMKSTCYIFLFIFMSWGCTKLDSTIYSNLTTGNAYSTEADAQASVVGLYSILDGEGEFFGYYNGMFALVTEYGTDVGYSTKAGNPSQMTTFSYQPGNGLLLTNWNSQYRLVSGANTLLSKIADLEVAEEAKNQMIGQARFLRALAYRDLTDAWGPVPFITEEIDPDLVEDMPLTPVDEIESFMIADCEFAIEHLPEQWGTSEGLTRATKGAALTLLGKIYMRKHDYATAKTYIDQVLAMEQQGLYHLNPDFKNVWSGSNLHDDGMIFGILHDAARRPTFTSLHFGPADNKDIPSRWSYYGISLDFWRKYHDDDPRKAFFWYDYEGSTPRGDGSGYGLFYKMPDPGENTPPNDTTILLKDVTTKKYTYEMNSKSEWDDRTIIIFRLADVILCKAEIENALNGPAAALPYLNRVRERAGAPLYGVDARFPAPGNQNEMADRILDERGFELVFEFQRRPDLIRFGKLLDVCNAYIENYLGLNVRLTENNIYFPYPFQDTRYNSYMRAENEKRIVR